jgi:hypothetical protein
MGIVLFLFVIGRDLFNWKQICAGFHYFFIPESVWSLEIQLSWRKGCDPINRFNPTCVRLSQFITWVSIGSCSFWCYWLNCWLSLFKFSFHKIVSRPDDNIASYRAPLGIRSWIRFGWIKPKILKLVFSASLLSMQH